MLFSGCTQGSRSATPKPGSFDHFQQSEPGA